MTAMPPEGDRVGDDVQSVAEDKLRLAAAVHDVNQMLAAIIGRAELLLARRPDERAAVSLGAILLAARDAVGMLERLRRPGAVDAVGVAGLRQALAEAALLVVPPAGRWSTPAAAASSGEWYLENDVPEDLGCALPAAVCREVLTNLLSNALQAMPGGGRVTCRAERRGDRVRLSVADTGPGIDPAEAERIFAVGFTTSGQPDRGVGLAGCRQLLAPHEATLIVGEARGCGADFLLEAPFAAPPMVPVPAGKSSPAATEAEPALSVLVVDDEAAVRDMLQDVLGELGCRVTCARRADEVLDGALAKGVDLVLVDHTLPGLSGLELARHLRAEVPDLVLVLMTALGNEEVLTAAAEGPVDLTATKPLDLSQLRELLHGAAVLSRQRAAADPSPAPAKPMRKWES